jgi:hypothetical protein
VPSKPSSGPKNTLGGVTGPTAMRRHGIATPPIVKRRSSTSCICMVPAMPRIWRLNSIPGGCAPVRCAAEGVTIVRSAPVSRRRLIGTPLASGVTNGTPFSVATMISPIRFVPKAALSVLATAGGAVAAGAGRVSGCRLRSLCAAGSRDRRRHLDTPIRPAPHRWDRPRCGRQLLRGGVDAKKK